MKFLHYCLHRNVTLLTLMETYEQFKQYILKEFRPQSLFVTSVQKDNYFADSYKDTKNVTVIEILCFYIW